MLSEVKKKRKQKGFETRFPRVECGGRLPKAFLMYFKYSLGTFGVTSNYDVGFWLDYDVGFWLVWFG